MSPKFSIFPMWLPSGEYSKTFTFNVVVISEKLYSKLKVAYKNAQKWTKTLFFKHEPECKVEKMMSL